jgi:hypothetical protein
MPAIPKPIARRPRWNSAAPIRAHPCIIAAFLVSDPPLKQVVSRTVEAGLRGTKELNIGTLGWKLGGFRATTPMTSSRFRARCCRDLAISRTSVRRAARASRPKSI